MIKRVLLVLIFSLILLLPGAKSVRADSHDLCRSVNNFTASPTSTSPGSTITVSGQIENCVTRPTVGRLSVSFRGISGIAQGKTTSVPINNLDPITGGFSVNTTLQYEGTWRADVVYAPNFVPADREISINVSYTPGEKVPQASFTECFDLPGSYSAPCFPGLDPKFNNLGSLITNFMDLVFALVGFLAFIMLLYGALRYIFAGGDKHGLQSARNRMIYAIVGLIVVALAFAVAQFLEQILAPTKSSPISFVTTAYAQTTKTPLGSVYDFGGYTTLGGFISNLLPTIFSIAAAGVVFYFIFGAFKWLTSGGNKEGISSGRSMITHAVIGFFLLMMIFLIMQYLPQALGFNFNIF